MNIQLPEEMMNHLRVLETGLMFFETIRENNSENEEYFVSFIIKEDQRYLNKLKAMVTVELQTIGADIDGVFLIDVLLKTHDNDCVYETMINARNRAGKEAVASLANKDKFFITFINENNEIYRQIVVNNSGRKDFKKYEYRLTEWEEWSMSDFDMAKEKFMTVYPDIVKLWNKISKRLKK